MENLYVISEVTSIIQDYKILNESKDDKGDWKITFQAILQTADVPNQNQRIYPAEILKEAVEKQLQPKAKMRALYGELDHPPRTHNEMVDISRHSTVSLKEASHLITHIEFDGKYVKGTIETLNTPNGNILTNLIKDKCAIGFSIRSLGMADQKGKYWIVKKPFIAVTYDVVSNPSHQETLMQVVNENQVIQLLQENNNLFGNSKSLSLSDLFIIHIENLKRKLK